MCISIFWLLPFITVPCAIVANIRNRKPTSKPKIAYIYNKVQNNKKGLKWKRKAYLASVK